MKQKPCMTGREKRRETKAIYDGRENGMKQKPCMTGREKWHETKAKYEGKNGMKQNPLEEKKEEKKTPSRDIVNC